MFYYSDKYPKMSWMRVGLCAFVVIASLSGILYVVFNSYFQSPTRVRDGSLDVKQVNKKLQVPEAKRVWDERTGAENGPEGALWYLHEDLLANAHHRFWHSAVRQKPVNRGGELFYFMHHEIIARNAVARLVEGMPPVQKLDLLQGTPLIPYNSHLAEWGAGITYDSRPEGTKLSDIPDWNLAVADLEDLRQKVIADIQRGIFGNATENEVNLSSIAGINILGEFLMMNVDFSLADTNKFTGFHGLVHGLIARAANPNTSKAPYGVMAFGATALRDPTFYLLHRNIDEVLGLHKDSLPPYGLMESEFPLKWNGASIEDFWITSDQNSSQPRNELKTFWETDTYSLIRGIDWFRNETIHPPVNITQKHLNYEDFTYTITVNATEHLTTSGTVRIFLAPRFNATGDRYSIDEQRQLFFTLDRFKVNLTGGMNEIRRSSRDSALTLPARAWLENMTTSLQDDFCGCGWPNHLLIPKGTARGMPFDLFVMVTKDDWEVPMLGSADGDWCSIAPIWCPLHHEKYSDGRPMGYPFDRMPYSVEDGNSSRMVQDLEEYVKPIPNMKAIQVRIFHQE